MTQWPREQDLAVKAFFGPGEEAFLIGTPQAPEPGLIPQKAEGRSKIDKSLEEQLRTLGYIR
jgi:hypothetical protein